MSQNRLWILIALALAVGAGALWLSRHQSSQRESEYGTPVFPALGAELDKVDSLRVVGAGDKPLVTLKRNGGGWLVADPGYPADSTRVRRLLVALADLKVVEPKTQDPARYAALGVEDVADPKAQSVRLELGGLAEPLALLVGHAAAGQNGYLRVVGHAQALEARPGLDVARSPRDWLARSIVDIGAARVHSVTVERTDAPPWRAVKATRDAPHFEVPGLPKGKELASLGAADVAGNTLSNVELDAVRKVQASSTRPQRVIVECFDGLVVTVEGRSEGDARWVTVAARYDAALAARYPAPPAPPAPGAGANGAPPAAAAPLNAAAEATRLAAQTAGWEYQVPAYRFDALFRKRDELLRH